MSTYRENMERVNNPNPAAPPPKKKINRKANPWPRLGNAPLEELLRVTNAPPEWDVILLGDGSGYPDNQNAGGYATIIIDRFGNRDIIMGSGRFSSYQAELEAPVQGIMWYHSNWARKARAKLGRNVLNVLIFSDNEAVVAVGNKGGVPSNMELQAAPLWMAFVGVQQMGYRCSWRWLPRDVCSLHLLVDHASRASRQNLNDLVPGLQGIGLEYINPVSVPVYEAVPVGDNPPSTPSSVGSPPSGDPLVSAPPPS